MVQNKLFENVQKKTTIHDNHYPVIANILHLPEKDRTGQSDNRLLFRSLRYSRNDRKKDRTGQSDHHLVFFACCNFITTIRKNNGTDNQDSCQRL